MVHDNFTVSENSSKTENLRCDQSRRACDWDSLGRTPATKLQVSTSFHHWIVFIMVRSSVNLNIKKEKTEYSW